MLLSQWMLEVSISQLCGLTLPGQVSRLHREWGRPLPGGLVHHHHWKSCRIQIFLMSLSYSANLKRGRGGYFLCVTLSLFHQKEAKGKTTLFGQSVIKSFSRNVCWSDHFYVELSLSSQVQTERSKSILEQLQDLLIYIWEAHLCPRVRPSSWGILKPKNGLRKAQEHLGSWGIPKQKTDSKNNELH